MVVFILAFEKRWESWMIFASRVKDGGEYYMVEGRYNGEEEEGIPPVVRQTAALCLKYDSVNLYRQFGRKRFRDEREFMQKADEAFCKEYIHPYVDKYMAVVLNELTEADLPVFLKTGRLDNLYKSKRLLLQNLPLRALLKFERKGEYVRYILWLTDGKRVFDPCDYDIKILTRQPCRILMGRQVFGFPEDFDGQRLVPFLTKREIVIPKSKENEYFRKFILKNVRNEEIEVQGFEVIIRETEKHMILSLEREVFAQPVLAVEFRYGDQVIPAWSSRKALVELRTEKDTYAFYKTNRDSAWEREQIAYLEQLGLMEKNAGYMIVREAVEIPEAEKTRDTEGESSGTDDIWLRTVEWIRRHLAELREKGIVFTQKALRQAYYVGNWQMEYSGKETVDWFELKAQVILEDGRKIPLFCFKDHILAREREFLLGDGTLFLIPEEWFAAYGEILLFAQGKGSSLFLQKNQYPLLSPEVRKAPEKTEEAIPLPEDFRAVLRPYQKTGYDWMYGLYRNHFGGCLADDMGLGKTVQAIAMILKYRQETVKQEMVRKFPERGAQLALFEPDEESSVADEERKKFHTCLIIVPASLVHNWKNELHKFAPQLSVTVYTGSSRFYSFPCLTHSDVVITTYHTLRNDVEDFVRLNFGFVILDEAQVLKNPNSLVHQAVSRIHGEYFLALSGTPIENSLRDLWAIMNLINRGMLGTYFSFSKRFVRPILSDLEGSRSRTLKKMIAPYILRRTKEEVLPDLPELTEELIICEPDEEQRRLYDEEKAKVRNYIFDKQVKQEGLHNDFVVLQALTKLRQIANHPRMIDEAYASGSGKFDEIFRMLTEVIDAGHKVLLFSAFVKFLNMVALEARQRSWEYAMLIGSTMDREQEIRKFASDAECHLFLISLKAGGVGLNLTEADYVFILDPWWNVAAENQAVGRAHRIGQKQAVFVYRFITAGTLEEKILAIQQRKQQISDAVVSTASSSPWSDEEILEVL